MAEGPTYSLRRYEILRRKSVIQELWKHPQSTRVATPIRLSYSLVALDTRAPAQVLFAVGKKKLKRAHDRNRVKRLMRESYRLNKIPLYNTLKAEGMQCALILQYLAPSVEPHEHIYTAIKYLLEQMAEHIVKTTGVGNG